MNRCKRYVLTALVALPLFYFSGCRNAVRFPAQFQLGAGLGSFVVTAGETAQKSGTGSLPDSNISIGSGAIVLDPNDVHFTPAGSSTGKGLTTFQAGGSFTVTAGIAAFEDSTTVCDAPVDEYGPFTVTLNADSTINTISPASFELEQTTIDLINSGQFSVCLTIDDSTVSGELTIAELSFMLGL